MSHWQGIHEAWGRIWPQFSELRRKFPLWMQVSVVLLLLVLLSAGIHSIFLAHEAVLHLRVQHNLRSAQIAVFVDDDAVYNGKLTGAPRKKYKFFGEAIQGSLTQEIPVSAGSHRVRVQITSSDGTVQQDSSAQDFVSNGDLTLLVNARRGNLELSWAGGDGGSSGSVSSATSGGGWLSRYSTTLLMTLAGSIVSALTGFIIREIPGYLKSRQASQ